MCVCLCRYPLPLGRVHSHTPRGSLPAYSVFNLDFLNNLILYNQVEGGWDTQTCSCRAGSDRGVAAAAVAVGRHAGEPLGAS